MKGDSTVMGSDWEKDILAAVAPHIQRAASEAYSRGVADGVAKERNRVLGLIGGIPSVIAAPEPEDDDGDDDEISVGVSDERRGSDAAPEYGAISTLVRKALAIAGEEGAATADIIRIIKHSTGTSLEPDQVRQNLKIQAKNGYAIRVQRGRYKASDQIAAFSSETARSEPVDAKSVEDTSTGSNPTPAQGREAGPGGGT